MSEAQGPYRRMTSGRRLWLVGLALVLVTLALVASSSGAATASPHASATQTGRLLGLTFPAGMGTTGSLVEVNTSTGAFTTIAPVPSFTLTSGIVALDSAARRLYVQRTDDGISLRAFDTQTGAFTDASLSQQLLALGYEPASPALYLPIVAR